MKPLAILFLFLAVTVRGATFANWATTNALQVGTNGQVLVATGTNTPPVFQTIATGGGSSNAATVITNIVTTVPVNTNQLILSGGWGWAFLNNSTGNWNPAFNIDGSGGAYTNANWIEFLDAAGNSIQGGFWVLSSNKVDLTGSANGQYAAAATPVNNSWVGGNSPPPTIGTTFFPSQTNNNLVAISQPLNSANFAVVIVQTNGWTSPTGWVTETNAGQSLADALAYYGLWRQQTQIFNNGNGNLNYINNTNWTGGVFILGPAPAWVNPFYLPQGFTINSINANSSWQIYGQGLNTCILGDSNALNNAVGTNALDTPMPKENIHDLLFCSSNYLSKAFCVNLFGNAYLNFHDNYMVPYICISPTNTLQSDTIDSAPAGYAAGIMGLQVSGNTGEQWVEHNVIDFFAAGIVAIAEHQRWNDNEIRSIGASGNGGLATQWATNDNSVVAIGDSGNVYGHDISLAPCFVLAGEGDAHLTGDKTLGGGIGVLVKGTIAPNAYGPDIIEDVHFEALGRGPVNSSAADILVATNSQALVEAKDCYDQQTHFNNEPVVACGWDEVGFNIQTNPAVFQQAKVVATSMGYGFSPAGGSLSHGQLSEWVNNAQVFYTDPFNSVFWLNPSWKYVGNSGLTNANSQLSTLAGSSLVSSNQAALIAAATSGIPPSGVFYTNTANALPTVVAAASSLTESNITALGVITGNGSGVTNVAAAGISTNGSASAQVLTSSGGATVWAAIGNSTANYAVTNFTTTSATNGPTRGTWELQLLFNDAVTGNPAVRITRPGILTNTIAPLSPALSQNSTNFLDLPVNPNTTNTATDVSGGTGASVTVLKSQILN